MHPERGILHTHIWSDSISTRPDKPNTLTRQSDNTNDAPRDPLPPPDSHHHYTPNFMCCYVGQTINSSKFLFYNSNENVYMQ